MSKFVSFFKSYSQNVDRFDEAAYWQLSDEIIKRIIKKNLPPKTDFTLFDAGGGSGRWTVIVNKMKKCHGTLFDLSKDMLAKAKINFNQAGIEKKFKIVLGNLEKITSEKDNSYDLIICIYNVLSFIKKPEKTIDELYRILKPKGRLIVMAHGFYNAIEEKVVAKATKKDFQLITQKSKINWNPRLPTLKLYSREGIEALLKNFDFKVIKTYGVTVFAKPELDDFQYPYEGTSRISQSLKDPEFFKEIINLEIKYNFLPEIANHGVNLLSVAEK